MRSYSSLRSIVDETAWPHEILSLVSNDAASGVLDYFANVRADFSSSSNGVSAFIVARVMLDLEVPIPFLPGCSLIAGYRDDEDQEPIEVDFFSGYEAVPVDQEDQEEPEDEGPRPPIIDVAIRGDVFGLRLSREWLKPVELTRDQNGGIITWQETEGFVDVGLGAIVLSARCTADGWTFDFERPPDASLDLSPCVIGDTGIILEAHDVALNLSGTGPRPAGAPAGWQGLYIGSAAIYIPAVMSTSISVTELGIGSGGFYGGIHASNLNYSGTVLGVQGGIQSIDIEFVQSVPVEAAISGWLTLPFFDQRVEVEIGIDLGGSVSVKLTGAGESSGLLTLTKEGLFTLTIDSLGFEVEDGQFAAKLSGSIQPLIDIGGAEWPAFKVSEMTIHPDGRVDLDGGWLNLPEQHRLDFHGFSAELTQIGFGDTDDGYRWIGFSGGIQLVADLGLGATFDALRIEWPKEGAVNVDTIRLSLKGIGVDLTIPDVLAFKGTVRFINDTADPDPARHQKGFKGGVKLTLYSINLVIDAEILAIKTGGFTSFYIYVNTDFPAGIPLASTGVALYGLAGLLGQNVAPNKTAEEAWYENWYKGQRLEGPRQDPGAAAAVKWDPAAGSMAFGAGVTVGTVSDNGFAVNGKLLLVLILPGPIILLEGRANLLTERSKLGAGEPTFEALAVLDGRAGQFLLNVAAQYKKDSEGRIIDIRAGAEAFFDYHRADAWHLYLGQDEPREKRIRAAVLSLFHADSYFMLTGRDLRLGFWVGFDERWRFGPLSVGLSAWISADAAVSWKPVHLHGQLQLHGGFELRAFGIGLSIDVDARIAADAPTPYHLLADLHVKLGLPWPLPDLEATVGLEWGEPHMPLPPVALPLGAASCEHLKVTEKWPLDPLPRWDDPAGALGAGFWDGTDKTLSDDEEARRLNTPYDEDGTDFVGIPEVPLDVRPVLSFAKPVFDDVGFGEMREGQVEQVGESAFEYHLVHLALETKPRLEPDAAWQTVAIRSSDRAIESNRHRLRGAWQVVASGADAAPNTKLMLWSRTSYDWTREQAGPMYGRWIRGNISDAFCPPASRRIKRCVGWNNIKAGTRYHGSFDAKPLRFIVSQPKLRLDVVHRPRAAFASVHGLRIPGASSVDPPQLTITGFPYGTTRVRVSVDAPMSVRADAYYRQSLKATDTGSPGLSTLTVDAAAIDTVIVRPTAQTQGVNTYLYRICYEAPLNPERQRVYIEWMNSVDETRETWHSTDSLLEPDRYYKLTVKTTVARNGQDVRNGPFTQSVYFQTGHPPGIVAASHDQHAADLTNQHEHFPTKGPLKDLRPYVEYTVPAADARAVFRAYDVGAYFNENYVDAMYQLAGRPLRVLLYDAKGDLVAGLTNEWGENPRLSLSHTEVQWLYSLDQATCVDSLDTHDVPSDQHLNARSAPLLLRPEASYEARLTADSNEDGADEPRAVYTWRFITSRFAHFRHHIGSFGDFLWDEHLLRGQPEKPLVSEQELARLQSLVTAERDGLQLPDGDDPRFDEIAALFGFGTEPQDGQPGRWLRPQSQGVDLTLLRDATRRYAVLLETAEPLHQDRVSTTARYEAVARNRTVFTGTVKIFDARLSPAAGTANEEYVDILVLQDLDMSNWRVEHVGSADLDASNATFALYYTFPVDMGIVREGTLVRVHTGRRVDDQSPAPTYLHQYAGQMAFVLNGSGDWLRLVHATGDSAHERFFTSPIADLDLHRAMVPVWNRDRTAAFLFFPDDGSAVGIVPDGQYRLSCTFRRTAPGRPTLKQEGQATDETAHLEFVISR